MDATGLEMRALGRFDSLASFQSPSLLSSGIPESSGMSPAGEWNLHFCRYESGELREEEEEDEEAAADRDWKEQYRDTQLRVEGTGWGRWAGPSPLPLFPPHPHLSLLPTPGLQGKLLTGRGKEAPPTVQSPS